MFNVRIMCKIFQLSKQNKFDQKKKKRRNLLRLRKVINKRYFSVEPNVEKRSLGSILPRIKG